MGCPMGFGELQLPSSRAFWDDCEEDELTEEQVEKLQLVFDSDAEKTPFPCELFLVLEGPKITEFASKTILQNAKRICTVPPANNSAMYYIEAKSHMLAIIDDNLVDSGEISELLAPFAKKARQVVTVSLKPKVDFKSEEIEKYRDVIAIVRAIGETELKNIQQLESPNFIVGVGAGVANWRNISRLSSNSYVIYTDKLPLDAIAAEPVLNLLKEIGIDCANNYTPTSKNDSYLYL